MRLSTAKEVDAEHLKRSRCCRDFASCTYLCELQLVFCASQIICNIAPPNYEIELQGTRSGFYACAGAFLFALFFFSVGCRSPPPFVQTFLPTRI